MRDRSIIGLSCTRTTILPSTLARPRSWLIIGCMKAKRGNMHLFSLAVQQWRESTASDYWVYTTLMMHPGLSTMMQSQRKLTNSFRSLRSFDMSLNALTSTGMWWRANWLVASRPGSAIQTLKNKAGCSKWQSFPDPSQLLISQITKRLMGSTASRKQ